MDVDEAGRDDRTRGVDLAPAPFLSTSDGDDAVAVDRDVAAYGGAPVPSTTKPPRITMS